MWFQARFVLPVVAVIVVLTFVASAATDRLTRSWFEKDLRMRARLAVHGTEENLSAHLRARDAGAARRVLDRFARDERLLASAVCGIDAALVAKTFHYPADLDCVRLAGQLSARAAEPGGDPAEVDEVVRLPGGEVHVSAFPLSDEGGPLGFVVVVHDMSFLARRSGSMQRLLLFLFGLLAAALSVVTVSVARWTWRGWTREVRRMLANAHSDDPSGGRKPTGEFQPIAQDVRALVDRITTDLGTGGWTPLRLRHTLTRHLRGERVIVLANRQPFLHHRASDGSIQVLHPASGLVTALEPVMRVCSGVWVAHGNGSADREVVDGHDRIWVPPGDPGYQIRRVWLTPEEEQGYYYSFANEGLWPLCHLVHVRPEFRAADWEKYRSVNAKFAEAALKEADSDSPIILVQDYHFALVPRMLRQRLPQATILAFWHVPWPSAQRFGICPWRSELLDGLLGSSILGFHTQLDCNNFVETVDRYIEARIDREELGVERQGQATRVRAYPISVEWPMRGLETAPTAAECRKSVLAELGLRPDHLLGVGVDRLDYTKGIEERFKAVEALLERFPQFQGRFTFVQIGAPSRTAIEQYRLLGERIEAMAERVNQRFGRTGYRPIVLKRSHHEPPEVLRYLRAADVCYVSSLSDGMNLVAKEFVVARGDERGVLVLSQFAGASKELTAALIVNPYDLTQASSALAAALSMPADEQGERMRAMRTIVSEFNVYRWAGRMLVDAAQTRARGRLSGLLEAPNLEASGR